MAIFIKVLTANDVERRLGIPEGCVSSLPRSEWCNETVLLVKDDPGKLWKFNCMIKSGPIKKLVIFSGWTQFVRAYELHSGDVVMLYKEDDVMTGSCFKIEVKRSYTLSNSNEQEGLRQEKCLKQLVSYNVENSSMDKDKYRELEDRLASTLVENQRLKQGKQSTNIDHASNVCSKRKA